AVLVAIDVNKSGQAVGQQLAEVVVRAVDVLAQNDIGQLVVAGVIAALCADAVLAIEIAGGLAVGERVVPGPESGKGVRAVAAGGLDRDVDLIVEVVLAGEGHGRAGDARFPGILGAVVVGVY